MPKFQFILIAIICTSSGVHGSSDARLDLTPMYGDEGLKKWIEIQKEVVGTVYFQYYDEVEFTLAPGDGKPLDQLTSGNELGFLKSTLQLSPQGTRSANMFVYNIESHDSGWVPHRMSPDKYVYLFEATDTRGWPIVDLGSSSELHAVGWSDKNTIIVFGTVPDVRYDRLNAWRVSVEFPNIRRERFLGPPVNDRQSAALHEQWRNWLQDRHPSVNWGDE
jgi:hypothetical protein